MAHRFLMTKVLDFPRLNISILRMCNAECSRSIIQVAERLLPYEVLNREDLMQLVSLRPYQKKPTDEDHPKGNGSLNEDKKLPTRFHRKWKEQQAANSIIDVDNPVSTPVSLLPVFKVTSQSLLLLSSAPISTSPPQPPLFSFTPHKSPDTPASPVPPGIPPLTQPAKTPPVYPLKSATPPGETSSPSSSSPPLSTPGIQQSPPDAPVSTTSGTPSHPLIIQPQTKLIPPQPLSTPEIQQSPPDAPVSTTSGTPSHPLITQPQTKLIPPQQTTLSQPKAIHLPAFKSHEYPKSTPLPAAAQLPLPQQTVQPQNSSPVQPASQLPLPKHEAQPQISSPAQPHTQISLPQQVAQPQYSSLTQPVKQLPSQLANSQLLPASTAKQLIPPILPPTPLQTTQLPASSPAQPFTPTPSPKPPTQPQAPQILSTPETLQPVPIIPPVKPYDPSEPFPPGPPQLKPFVPKPSLPELQPVPIIPPVKPYTHPESLPSAQAVSKKGSLPTLISSPAVSQIEAPSQQPPVLPPQSPPLPPPTQPETAPTITPQQPPIPSPFPPATNPQTPLPPSHPATIPKQQITPTEIATQDSKYDPQKLEKSEKRATPPTVPYFRRRRIK